MQKIKVIHLVTLNSFLLLGCKTIERSHLSEKGDRLELLTDLSRKHGSDKGMRDWKSYYEDKVAKNSKDAQAWGQLAKIAVAERDFVKTRELASKALSFDINQEDAKIALLQMTLMEGDLAKAKVMLASLQNKSKASAEVLHMAGMIAMEDKHPSEAAAYWEKALSQDSQLMATRFNLAVLQLNYFQFQSAAGHLERIVSKMPKNNEAKIYLAVAKSGYGDSKGAEKLFEELAGPESSNPIFLFNYAVFLKQNKKWEESLSYFKSYLKESEKSGGDQRDRAMLLASEVEDLIEGDKTQKMSAQDFAKVSKVQPAPASQAPKTEKKEPKSDDSFSKDLDQLEKELLK